MSEIPDGRKQAILPLQFAYNFRVYLDRYFFF